MSEETPNIRRERIEKILNELRYEVERGMLQREIDEEMTFRFVVPMSQKIPYGVVLCEFRTRPCTKEHVLASTGPSMSDILEPRLKVVP